MEIASDTTKTKSSMRTLPLVDSFRELLLRKQQEQARYRKLCGRSYCTKYLDYICVNELGERLKPNTLSNGFRRLLEENDMRVIRLHDLRHSCASLLLAEGIPMKFYEVCPYASYSKFNAYSAVVVMNLDVWNSLPDGTP